MFVVLFKLLCVVDCPGMKDARKAFCFCTHELWGLLAVYGVVHVGETLPPVYACKLLKGGLIIVIGSLNTNCSIWSYS